jgi:hypothetical protein
MRTKQRKAALIATVIISSLPVLGTTAVTPNAHTVTTGKIAAAESATTTPEASPAYYHDM